MDDQFIAISKRVFLDKNLKRTSMDKADYFVEVGLNKKRSGKQNCLEDICKSSKIDEIIKNL